VNRRKPHVQTLVVSRYPAPAPLHNFVLLFLSLCSPHLTPLATESLEPRLLVSPLLGGPTRHRPFAPTLHLHQRKSSRNLHLQYSTKSQSTPCCQSLITTRSDHPSVLGRFGPQRCYNVSAKCHIKKPKTMTIVVGYAVDDLGFYHIPHGPITPSTMDSITAVMEGGSLTEEELRGHLRRLFFCYLRVGLTHSGTK
jgi:hypothetical protein